ncbi:hypothetical protein [Marisediminicola sp. LYQ134]|uniref:hypothetical protein n=1 Tax=unclassified Marisediminicola TaxID=2618316 RepID=UPI00398322A0
MTESTPPRALGIGRVLIVVYGILALAATGRSVFQILTKFGDAPVAYSLSALAAVVYILATVALVVPGDRWYRVALATIGFELVGVIVVGVLSIFDPVLFPDDTVWSRFGQGYLFIPLVLPVLGLLWLRRRRRNGSAGVSTPDGGAPAARRS